MLLTYMCYCSYVTLRKGFKVISTTEIKMRDSYHRRFYNWVIFDLATQAQILNLSQVEPIQLLQFQSSFCVRGG